MRCGYLCFTLSTCPDDQLVDADVVLSDRYAEFSALRKLDMLNDVRHHLRDLVRKVDGMDPADISDPDFVFDGYIGQVIYDTEEDHTTVKLDEIFGDLLPSDRREALSEWILLVHGLYQEAYTLWEAEARELGEEIA